MAVASAALPIPIPTGGGGIVGLIVAVLAALVGGGFGVNAAIDGGGEGTGDNSALEQKCDAADRLQQLDCRNALYVNSIQAYWTERAAGELRRAVPAGRHGLLRPGRCSTGCGAADSGVGPFYCPGDHQVYIDLTFYQVLADQFGAAGEFAQPYVLAHEYGHHVQTLLGTEARDAPPAGARPGQRQPATR